VSTKDLTALVIQTPTATSDVGADAASRVGVQQHKVNTSNLRARQRVRKGRLQVLAPQRKYRLLVHITTRAGGSGTQPTYGASPAPI
jgi:hypothetical protein